MPKTASRSPHNLFTLHSSLLPAIIGAVCAVLTCIYQRYKMVDLEESYIFFFDGDYLRQLLCTPGGFAQIAASFCTQFMRWIAAGPLIVFVIYFLISLCLGKVGRRLGMPHWGSALAAVPCVCLMLCLESNSYRFCGHIAVLLAVAVLLLYSVLRSGALLRTLMGAVLTAALYQAAGPVSVVFAVSALLYDALSHRPRWWLSVIYACVSLACSQASYMAGWVPTDRAAFMPGAYYLWNSSAYMMLYAWCSIPLFILSSRILGKSEPKKGWQTAALAAAVLVVSATCFIGLYGTVHSHGVYRTMQQRYYAKHADWDAIIALDYGAETTPYTSYRNLALAHKGMMSAELERTRSYISYFMKNQTLVKKEDQQILSDIYYDCGFWAGARHSAFDTDIVTPGKFNPVETLKLAEINILYGDYAVAEKLISQLEKTLFYSGKAKALRKYLYDDAAIASDPEMARKRALVPAESNYTSPKGLLRDLTQIVATDPGQTVAVQFLESFRKLNRIDK